MKRLRDDHKASPITHWFQKTGDVWIPTTCPDPECWCGGTDATQRRVGTGFIDRVIPSSYTGTAACDV